MQPTALPILFAALTVLSTALPAQSPSDSPLAKALTFHASFDNGFDADFSKGSKACTVKQGKETVPATENAEVKIVSEGAKHGKALHFTKKGATRPQYGGQDGVLGYNDKSWSATVSVWLRLTPDGTWSPATVTRCRSWVMTRRRASSSWSGRAMNARVSSATPSAR
jgi:hypothetical protein